MFSPIIRTGMVELFAQADITCYILRGAKGDMLIDTGMPHIWHDLQKWLCAFEIKHVFLTHAHADHDWNAAKLQKAGAKILLSEKDLTLRRNFMSQPVKPTSPKYRFRNYTQLINGTLFKSPPYEPDIIISGEDTSLLEKLGYTAQIVPLPGHTYGSLGILSGDVLYCGDAFTMFRRKPDITPHAVSIELMCRSLETILALSPKLLCCGHGLPVPMKHARPVMEEYLSTHKEMFK